MKSLLAQQKKLNKISSFLQALALKCIQNIQMHWNLMHFNDFNALLSAFRVFSRHSLITLRWDRRGTQRNDLKDLKALAMPWQCLGAPR